MVRVHTYASKVTLLEMKAFDLSLLAEALQRHV